MASNKQKYREHVMNIYAQVKQEDIADSYIVRIIFPKHHIYVSYNTFMRIKHPQGKKKIVDTNQISIFDVI
jgi:hypothetical protein